MILAVGGAVVYPCQEPCLVGATPTARPIMSNGVPSRICSVDSFQIVVFCPWHRSDRDFVAATAAITINRSSDRQR